MMVQIVWVEKGAHMSEISSGRHNSYFPVDNVQRIEKLKEDAVFLQTMADFNEDQEAIEWVSQQLEVAPLAGMPVSIQGGRVQVPAVGNSEGTYVLTPNTEASGYYLGMTWRQYDSDIFPGSTESHLLHVISTGEPYIYLDSEGNEVSVSPRTYVTAADSDLTITGQVGRHDFRRLANDGFSQKIDEIALDDSSEINEKLSLIARMFGEIPQDEDAKKDLAYQRLSYLNHLGIFNDYICEAKYAYSRKNSDTISVVFPPEGLRFTGTVVMAGFDGVLKTDDEGDLIISADEGLCLELFHPTLGYISVPYIEGSTRLHPNTNKTD